jgi:hypothetical protein
MKYNTIYLKASVKPGHVTITPALSQLSDIHTFNLFFLLKDNGFSVTKARQIIQRANKAMILPIVVIY